MASKNRAETEQFILEVTDAIDRSKRSTKFMREQFEKMDDERFDKWMTELREGRDFISVIMDNCQKHGISVENNLRVAKKYGIKMHQRIWTTDEATGVTTLSNHAYPIYYMPVRRQIETLENKRSVASDNKHIDELTGQVTGVSAASGISFPELLVMYSQGLDSSLVELMKYRGGDLKGNVMFNQSILNTGGVSIEALQQYKTSVKSTDTLNIFLRGMHYESNF